MKRSPDNQINASFIDILRMKWLVFLLRSSFFHTTSTVGKLRRHPVEQTAYWRDLKDNGYKSVFTNSWLVRQRNRSWFDTCGWLLDCWSGDSAAIPGDAANTP